jgi:hypothetical protein
VLDNTVAVAFGHQFILALHCGAHFDSLKRGLALAAAGRSDYVSPCTLSAAIEICNCYVPVLQLKNRLASIKPAFCLSAELSCTIANILWQGVTLAFQFSVGRAETWNCLEVLEACRVQLAALAAYRTAIARAVALAAQSSTVAAGPHLINLWLMQTSLFSSGWADPFQ